MDEVQTIRHCPAETDGTQDGTGGDYQIPSVQSGDGASEQGGGQALLRKALGTHKHPARAHDASQNQDGVCPLRCSAGSMVKPIENEDAAGKQQPAAIKEKAIDWKAFEAPL